MIQLGSKVKDKITGFSGIVVAITISTYANNRCGVQARELRNGIPVEVQWFETARLEEIYDYGL